ncbi:hypothetical protein [Nitrospirillum amazonense]|nr:hypothetical protein [Nitrospirillum amazonense]MDG3438960.1 hypothetical protein [Nitrospirillum amazonense]
MWPTINTVVSEVILKRRHLQRDGRYRGGICGPRGCMGAQDNDSIFHKPLLTARATLSPGGAGTFGIRIRPTAGQAKMDDREKQLRRILFRTKIILATIALSVVVLLVEVFKMPWWLAIVFVVVGFILNGLLAVWEDDLPGGFNNPHPPKVRMPRQRWPWSR